MTAVPVYFNNFGYTRASVPGDIRVALKTEIDAIWTGRKQARGAQQHLAGHIEREYYLEDSLRALETFALEQYVEYDRHFSYAGTQQWFTKPVEPVLAEAWVNFQMKHEYNPPHSHAGVASFVIWTHIPYDVEAERARFPHLAGHDNFAAAFNFLYPMTYGKVGGTCINVSKADEWQMIMFPAGMLHSVNPFFTSDEPRISVSGNIKLYTG